MNDELPASRRPTPVEPLGPFIHPADVADVEAATGLVLSITEDGMSVAVARPGWVDAMAAEIEGIVWYCLATPEKRAAFARFAVLTPSADWPRTKVFWGCWVWEEGTWVR